MTETHLLHDYPNLSAIVSQLDSYLEKQYPDFFGSAATHPVLPVKRSKVIHDNLWGTNRYSWRELLLIDSPILQRLRDIHQVGLAFCVYPSAQHTRFEHCLGVVTIASRIFDALLHRNRGEFENVARVIAPSEDPNTTMSRLRQELRLAALLHDTGHSLYSHTSERVYENLPLLRSGSAELKKIAAKQKGAGEVLSFCLANTKCVARLLDRAKKRLIGEVLSDDYTGEIDLTNVVLMIIGRARHPFIQFLGDIVSSGFDADKLDYLLRDARAAGLPLRYDLDRYLYAVRLDKSVLADGDGELQKLFESVGAPSLTRHPPRFPIAHSHYETYRLRLPKTAINAIEQIIICKMMLFSYLYHHPKVRSVEGMLERLLERMVGLWSKKGETDEQLLERFLKMTDSAVHGSAFTGTGDKHAEEYAYRISNRLLPREVYRLSGADASHAERALLTDFLTDLQDNKKREVKVAELEKAIGEELVKLDSRLGPTPEEALYKTGVWVDVPKAPKFEDVDDLVIGGPQESLGAPFVQVFPIGQWTQAYTHFRYYVRIFAFSEYWDVSESAAKTAMQRVIRIGGDAFYAVLRRTRQ